MYRLKTILVAALLGGFVASANAQNDNVVTATYGNATGNTTRTMTVALNHTNDYVAFRLVMTLPEGTTVTGVTAKAPLKNSGTIDLSTKGGNANESTDFKVPFKQNGTKCNIVGYNYNNEKILGASGDIILTVTLETASGVNFNADGVTTACTFVDTSAKEAELGEPVTVAKLWGDVNMDKKVNTTDVQAAANISVAAANPGAVDMFAADANGDGKINSNDVQKIANISVGN